MRLSQLARKINKTPTELIRFFQQQGRGPYTSHNNKVTDEDGEFAIREFKPELLESKEILGDEKYFIENNEKISKENINKNTINSTNDVSDHIKEKADQTAGKVEKEEITEDTIEVIRAPKLKLEGVKVVGKIELPEKKKVSKEDKKPVVEDKMVADAIQKALYKKSSGNRAKTMNERHSEKPLHGNRKKHPNHNRHNEMSYEEKLLKEKKQQEKKKELAAKKNKEKKKQYYLNQVQSSIPIPKSQPKKKTKKGVHTEDKPKEIIIHKNPIRRFWGWLNGEYDTR